jgi:hypothetical protein
MVPPYDKICENGDKVGVTLLAPKACHIPKKPLRDVEANGPPAYDEMSLTHTDPDEHLPPYLPDLWNAIKIAVRCAVMLMPIVGTAMDAASYLPAPARRKMTFIVTLLLVSFVSASIISAFFGPFLGTFMILYDWIGYEILGEFYRGRAVLGYFFAGWGLMVPLVMLNMMLIHLTPNSGQGVVYFIVGHLVPLVYATAAGALGPVINRWLGYQTLSERKGALACLIGVLVWRAVDILCFQVSWKKYRDRKIL